MNGSPPPAETSAFRSFWEWTGDHLPPFFDAPSTRFYRDCEIRLFETYFPVLKGKKIFKTDLWDEAKNTRILAWAAEREAEVYGIDISRSIARSARGSLAAAGRPAGFLVSDARSIGVASGAFDYLYSMGTIEHFRQYRLALAECRRVLKPGGRAIIGVPNLFDPFLRPAMVGLLNSAGWYAYGFEKSFSARGLERLLRGAGFRILDRTGILFIPGWLRMLDLYAYVRNRRSAAWTGPFIAPFAALSRRCPWINRYGYLVACVAVNPG
jgi:SAM-dependent methyltransferase